MKDAVTLVSSKNTVSALKKINRSPHFREDAKTYSSYRVSINLRLISINIIVLAAKLHFFEDIIKQISHFFDDNIELTLHFFEDKVILNVPAPLSRLHQRKKVDSKIIF